MLRQNAVVLSLKISLRFSADRTVFGRGTSAMYMTAVPAQPHGFAAGGKQASVGQLIHEQLESAFMLLFNIAHLFKQIGYIVKPSCLAVSAYSLYICVHS